MIDVASSLIVQMVVSFQAAASSTRTAFVQAATAQMLATTILEMALAMRFESCLVLTLLDRI